jgi:hypothetical protein
VGASGVAYNDFSNMNGGFYPDHQTHRDGIDTDTKWLDPPPTNDWFNLTAASANRLVALFNSSIGNQIDFVYVTMQPSPSNQFWNIVKNALAGGERLIPEAVVNATENSTQPLARRAFARQGRIRYASGHSDHFHIRWKRQ